MVFTLCIHTILIFYPVYIFIIVCGIYRTIEIHESTDCKAFIQVNNIYSVIALACITHLSICIRVYVYYNTYTLFMLYTILSTLSPILY